MKNKLYILALVVVTLLVGVRVGSGQMAPGRVRWEYKTIREWKAQPPAGPFIGWTEDGKKLPGDPFEKLAEKQQELGNDGWELAGTWTEASVNSGFEADSGTTSDVYLVYKRPKLK